MPETINFGQNFDIDLYPPDKIEKESGEDALLKLAPPNYKNTSKIVYDIMDMGYGVTPLRGIEGDPETQSAPGFTQKVATPGYYGGVTVRTEKEMTEAREWGSPNAPIDVKKLAMWSLKNQTEAALYRMRFTLSELFRTGTYKNVNAAGSVTHGDTLEGYAARNVFSPSIGWALDPSLADPIADLLEWKATLQAGVGATFDEESVLLARDKTLNDLFNTSVMRDKFKIAYGNTPIGLRGVNEILKGYNLPQLVEYNAHRYRTKAAARDKDRTLIDYVIPHGSLIWGGNRADGAQSANFWFTRNLTRDAPDLGGKNNPDYAAPNPNATQKWADGIVTLVEWQQMPPKLKTTLAFNGGPGVAYPSSFAGIGYDVPA